jgi:DNA invertase Pin-like site-specific DNA recombinase
VRLAKQFLYPSELLALLALEDIALAGAQRYARGERRRGLLVPRLNLFRLDRLTRSGIRDTFELVEELRGHGAEIVSIADGFSLAGPASEIVLAVMAWAAKAERLAISERIGAARERVEAEGGRWGRPRRVDARTLAKARALKAEGRSVRAIAIALKIPRATIARALADAAPVMAPLR